MKKVLLALLLTLCTQLTFGENQPQTQQVYQAGQQWAKALQSRNPENITALYAKDAILYATFTNMLDNKSEILNYFKGLTKKSNLKVTFNKQNVRLFGYTAINSGIYTFSYSDNGKTINVPARYTFVYTSTPNGLLIVDHHSSLLPLQK